MITVYKNPNGDTRTAKKDVSLEEFHEANSSHIEDVRSVMYFLSDMILNTAEFHDCTKKIQEKMFYRDFKHSLETGEDFTKSQWYNLHITTERHHLDKYCPDDVNLIDVLEMIADRVCAGMARSGEVYDINLEPEVLQKAIKNTMDLIMNRIEVVDPSEKYNTKESENKSTNNGGTAAIWTDNSTINIPNIIKEIDNNVY